MPETPSAAPPRLLAVLLLVGLAAGWLYAWQPASFPRHWLSRAPTGFYHELSDAFRAGQLHLQRPPDPRLVALSDPYDPAQNAAYRVNDLSYFHGRYYLYLGAVPALALFLPLQLLTGWYVSEEGAAVIFCLIGLAAGVGLICGVRRHYLSATSPGLVITTALALAFASGYYVVVRGTLVQHVAVATAYAFGMLALAAGARAVMIPRQTGLWLALASLELGAAIGSRPNYVFACLALLPPFFSWWRMRGLRWSPVLVRTALALALPLGLCMAGLVAYNYARFGRPFDFGQGYQLGEWDQRHLAYTGWGHASENIWNYLFGPAVYSAYFPFATAPTWVAVGILRHVPWLWLFPLAIGALLRRSTPRPLRTIGLSILLLSATNLLTLVFLPSGKPSAVLTSANARYVLDFLPGLTLFTGLGLMVFSATRRRPSRGRSGLAGITALLALASVLLGVSLDLNYFPAESYRPLAQVLNLPSHWLQLFKGPGYGPAKMEVIFPVGRSGEYEPLLSTGSAEATDLVYVFYESPSQIRFGLVSTASKGPMSPPVSVTYGQPHEISISMGSLYPPIGHPSLSGLDESQVAFLKRNLRIQLDGQTVFESAAHFYPSSPGQVRVGINRSLGSYSAGKFSGHIGPVLRLPVAPPDEMTFPAPHYGAVRMVLRFPAGKIGLQEPLVVSGVESAGDVIYVIYVSDRLIRLGFDHWGHPGLITDPIPIDYTVDHTVEIQLGSLLPPSGHVLLSSLNAVEARALKQRVQVILDGKTALDAIRDTYECSPYDVFIGRNVIGGSTTSSSFTGEIKDARRLPLPTSTSPASP